MKIKSCILFICFVSLIYANVYTLYKHYNSSDKNITIDKCDCNNNECYADCHCQDSCDCECCCPDDEGWDDIGDDTIESD